LNLARSGRAFAGRRLLAGDVRRKAQLRRNRHHDDGREARDAAGGAAVRMGVPTHP
jgi:hypothetical protein